MFLPGMVFKRFSGVPPSHTATHCPDPKSQSPSSPPSPPVAEAAEGPCPWGQRQRIGS